MRKMLLTSAGFENPNIGTHFLKLMGKDPSDTKILFIPTAARTKDAMFYVEKSKQELISVGIKEENLMVYNLDRFICMNDVEKINAVYVCGGDPFYLLYRIRESKFDSILEQLINNGITYVGASAGSVLAGPDINIPDRSKDNDINLKDFKGLSFTDIVIVPHYTGEQREGVELAKQNTLYPVIPLTDSQALLIIDEDIRIVE